MTSHLTTFLEISNWIEDPAKRQQHRGEGESGMKGATSMGTLSKLCEQGRLSLGATDITRFGSADTGQAQQGVKYLLLPFPTRQTGLTLLVAFPFAA